MELRPKESWTHWFARPLRQGSKQDGEPGRLAALTVALVLAGTLATLIAPPSLAAKASAGGGGDSTSLAFAVDRIRWFLMDWRAHWLISEGELHRIAHPRNLVTDFRPGGTPWWPEPFGIYGTHADATGPAAHFRPRHDSHRCSAYDSEIGAYEPRAGNGRQLRSPTTGFSVCPSWYIAPFETLTPTHDTDFDAAITPRHKPLVRARRDTLLHLLERVAHAHPHDPFLTGQRVRFLVDQQDFEGAHAVVATCGANPWWCAVLRGYVHTRTGAWDEAEAVFRAATAALGPAAACEWSDMAVFLPPAYRIRYESLPCAGRDTLNRWLWWLARPLWSEGGHPRWAEHEARRVLIRLKTALPFDERYSWRRELGNDARETMVLRYGWPSWIYWGGFTQDSMRDDVHARRGIPRNGPYTTYEYTTGRMALLPAASAIFDPGTAKTTDWSLLAPAASDTANPRQLWWPPEHFRSPRYLVQLPKPITHVLRRYDHAVLGTVIPVLGADSLRRRTGDTVTAGLWYSTEPDHAHPVMTATATIGRSPLRLHGSLAQEAGVAGIEIATGRNDGPPAARTRWGITPHPLRTLPAGVMALSDIVLLDLPPRATPVPHPDSAMAALAPSDRIRRGTPLHIYWETYGAAATDSLEHHVLLQRVTTQPPDRRFRIWLGLVGDENAPVSVAWTEGALGPTAGVVPDGPVPIIARTLTIDTRTLARGAYDLDVTIARPGGEPVRQRRTLVVH